MGRGSTKLSQWGRLKCSQWVRRGSTKDSQWMGNESTITILFETIYSSSSIYEIVSDIKFRHLYINQAVVVLSLEDKFIVLMSDPNICTFTLKPAMNDGPYFTNSICEGILTHGQTFYVLVMYNYYPTVINPSSLNKLI